MQNSSAFTLDNAPGSFASHASPVAFPLKRLVNFLVWITFASSFFVLSNPALVDLLMMGLIIALPLAGLTRFNQMMFFWLALMLIILAAGFFGVNFAVNRDKAFMHMVISVYLSLSAFVLAGYIAKSPQLHLRIIMNGYLIAALLTSLLGFIGYFQLIPGAWELFTKYDRIKGGFKDPNVFGPFLVPAILYAIHLLFNAKPAKAIFYAGIVGFLSLALLLSFSRGAWLHMAISGFLFIWLSFVFSGSVRDRLKIGILTGFAILGVMAILMVALQVPKIAALFEQRATLTQSYDSGHGSRFEGHEKAKSIIADNLFGIGPVQFGGHYHKEDIHNVYYQMFLSMGWFGGFAYLVLVFGTLLTGIRHLFRRSDLKPWLHIALASLIALALEGAIIDTDHWRHFYVLMAMIWGIVAYDRRVRHLT